MGWVLSGKRALFLPLPPITLSYGPKLASLPLLTGGGIKFFWFLVVETIDLTRKQLLQAGWSISWSDATDGKLKSFEQFFFLFWPSSKHDLASVWTTLLASNLQKTDVAVNTFSGWNKVSLVTIVKLEQQLARDLGKGEAGGSRHPKFAPPDVNGDEDWCDCDIIVPLLECTQS